MTTPLDVIEGRARFCVEHGDSAVALTRLPDACIDALVTDPPAGIEFMGREWDSDRGGRDAWIAWLAGILAECRRAMRPGAWALVWALPRTSHWTATAIEDAGFEVRDVVVHLTGIGWPKSRATLKPASEHWILARVPGPIVPLEIDATRIPSSGGGGDRADEPSANRRYADRGSTNFAALPGPRGGDAAGRWPANVTLEHSAGCRQIGEREIARNIATGERTDVRENSRTHGDGQRGGRTEPGTETVAVWECESDCAVRALDESTGPLTSGSMRAGTERKAHGGATYNKPRGNYSDVDTIGDSGGPSRFFYCARARSDAQRGHSNRHPTVKPIDLMRWLVRLVAKPDAIVLDPFTGSGTTGVACMSERMRFVGIEADAEYAKLARERVALDGVEPLFNAGPRSDAKAP